MSENKAVKKTIIFSGGGTGGPVTPLLAVADELLHEEQEEPAANREFAWRLIFVGTRSGPEKEMVAAFNRDTGALEYIPLISGKWRRYFSLQNFFDLFKILAAFFSSWRLLADSQPDLIISAGGFVSVPLVWAAYFKKIPILIHQQDVRPGLANRLMAPCARVISVAFEKSLYDYGLRAVWLGNPVRSPQDDPAETAAVNKRYNLTGEKPLVLVTGGGTGSTAINELVFKAAPELVSSCQIIHLTGKGKLSVAEPLVSGYRPLEFLSPDEVLGLMARADLVVSRGGLASLSELASLHKAAILIPIPNSHQEDNAAIFEEAQAALVLRQAELTPEKLAYEIKKTLADQTLQEKFENNIAKVMKRGAAEAMAGIIWEMIK